MNQVYSGVDVTNQIHCLKAFQLVDTNVILEQAHTEAVFGRFFTLLPPPETSEMSSKIKVSISARKSHKRCRNHLNTNRVATFKLIRFLPPLKSLLQGRTAHLLLR
ncbi:hypothetical protein CEXT_131111 [Caerostris extrusa]|uniref:Uncharacterized protein n=1 Tax=Caerostris extrusa TaxID=172846 RepID=A0AAV4Y8J5_CAEEX|nr:hypothetical protein CEXT_131111 [Caerostris extrusa]